MKYGWNVASFLLNFIQYNYVCCTYSIFVYIIFNYRGVVVIALVCYAEGLGPIPIADFQAFILPLPLTREWQTRERYPAVRKTSPPSRSLKVAVLIHLWQNQRKGTKGIRREERTTF